MQKKDLFAHKSKHWDLKSRRVQSAKAISDTILENISLNKEMHIMDFGAGTGLLSYSLSHTVGKVTALDNSPSMIEVFKEKAKLFNCPTFSLEHDLVHAELSKDIVYDGIVSSMTMHHIEDQVDMLSKMYALLSNNGFIALADLDSENGTFHSDNEGVFHYGFNRSSLKEIAQKVGFKEINFYTANVIEKFDRKYTVFLMVAKK